MEYVMWFLAGYGGALLVHFLVCGIGWCIRRIAAHGGNAGRGGIRARGRTRRTGGIPRGAGMVPVSPAGQGGAAAGSGYPGRNAAYGAGRNVRTVLPRTGQDLRAVSSLSRQQGTQGTGQASRTVSQASAVGRNSSRPRGGGANTEIFMFPRCPVCRCSNRPGESQKVFWDGGRQQWRCCKNHYFAS